MNLTRTTSERTFPRLRAAMALMLAWIGVMLFTDHGRINRHHIRRRYSWLSLHKPARAIMCLIIIRAAQLMPRLPQSPERSHASAGFQRRLHGQTWRRSIAGARVRKLLTHRDIATRFQRLVWAFNNIDRLARIIVRRLKRGATRLRPILPIAPPHTHARAVAPACAPLAADSS